MKIFRSKKYDSLTSLVRACQEQEPKAQTLFFERYKSRMTGICLRYARTRAEADDIFQEAFIRIFSHIDQLRNPEAADGWVKMLVIRTALNYYHRTTKLQDRHDDIHAAEHQVESDDYARMIDQLNVDDLLAIINELPDKYRTIINLYLIDGYSHAEIGEILSVSEATSRSQLMRGRNILLKKLESRGILHHENF
jgi:RNA polymerase sigma factor (sigma-70 family)